MMTSWRFGAGGDFLGCKHVFWQKKCEKLELYFKTVEINLWVVFTGDLQPNLSYRDDKISEKSYLLHEHGVFNLSDGDGEKWPN